MKVSLEVRCPILDGHKSGIDHGGRIFVLIMLYLWYKRINQIWK